MFLKKALNITTYQCHVTSLCYSVNVFEIRGEGRKKHPDIKVITTGILILYCWNLSISGEFLGIWQIFDWINNALLICTKIWVLKNIYIKFISNMTKKKNNFWWTSFFFELFKQRQIETFSSFIKFIYSEKATRFRKILLPSQNIWTLY